MENYAKVVANEVVDVMVADAEFAVSYSDKDGAEIIQSVDENGNAVRKNRAGIGYIYDRTHNAFIPPKPFASWSLNENTCLWQAPTPCPTDGKPYRWDETTLAWVEIVVPSV